MHVYVTDNYKHVHVLLNLQKVDGATFDKLTKNIVISLVEYRGVGEADLAQKIIYFGTNVMIIFQGAKIGLIIQLM